MKKIFLILCIPFFSFVSLTDSSSDFDKKLDKVVADFKLNIFNKQKCDSCSIDAKNIATAIQDVLDEGGIDKSEIKKMEALKKEADGLENYISAVGDLTGGFSTVADLNLANARVKGNISNESGKFCVDIISVTIGDFVCYLAENNSSKITSVNYKWKDEAGTNSGSGTIQVFANSIRAMYSNREKPKVNKVGFLGLNCK
ncbi:MAG: hypothetical protein NT084_08970 [Bacteroidetes bacterium]|nr:hypothetical protein [Bacteroidota bacterium]